MVKNKTILVTGANGQLGRELQGVAGAFPQFDFVFLGREELPVGDRYRVNEVFARRLPDFCVNCAAYTAVDKAETEKDTAFLINDRAVGWLAAACRDTGTRLIHISTDYVFDGHSETPLKEDSRTAPLSVYGASKLEGEIKARTLLPKDSLIIRTAWVYSEYGNNFVKTMIRLMKERPAIHVVSDQFGSPTYAADLAAAILQIIAAPNFVPGIYHYSNEGQVSWYEFALAIRALTGSRCEVHPIPTEQYPTPARRPRFSLLDKSLIRATYGLSIPEWRSSLTICLGRLGASA